MSGTEYDIENNGTRIKVASWLTFKKCCGDFYASSDMIGVCCDEHKDKEIIDSMIGLLCGGFQIGLCLSHQDMDNDLPENIAERFVEAFTNLSTRLRHEAGYVSFDLTPAESVQVLDNIVEFCPEAVEKAIKKQYGHDVSLVGE